MTWEPMESVEAVAGYLREIVAKIRRLSGGAAEEGPAATSPATVVASPS